MQSPALLRRKPPLAEQRRTVAVGPVGDAMEAIARAYEEESALLAVGDYRHGTIVLPSGTTHVLRSSYRAFHLHGARCVACGWEATHYLAKRADKRGGARLLLLDDPSRMQAVLLSADHVIPRSLGGPSDPGNLVPLCGPCNSRKGHRETHGRVRRWRVRELLEALVSACGEDALAQVMERYSAMRMAAFGPGRRGSAVAALTEPDALDYLRWCDPEVGPRIRLDDIRSTTWPGAPLPGLAEEDPWLASVAAHISGALERHALVHTVEAADHPVFPRAPGDGTKVVRLPSASCSSTDQ